MQVTPYCCCPKSTSGELATLALRGGSFDFLADEPNLIKLYLQQRGDRNSWNGTSRGEFDSNEASFSEEVCSKVMYSFDDILVFFQFPFKTLN